MKRYAVGVLVFVWMWFIYFFTAPPYFTSGQTGAFIQETGLFNQDIELTNSLLRKAANVILFGSLAIIIYIFF